MNPVPADLAAWAATLKLDVAVRSTYCPRDYRPPSRPGSLPSLSNTESFGPIGAPGAPGAEVVELIEKIGEGGMGTVFRGMQTSLGREVAVKLVRSHNADVLTHFVSEARVAGRLEHSGIVPVHLVGVSSDGTLQLVMRLVRGRPWSALIHAEANERAPLIEHLRILRSVCNAMSYAHANRILHRDLKPQNVMVAEFGQVFVVDWGVAVGTDPAMCALLGIVHAGETESPAGTPAYMAPELARGDGAAQDARTDVYLLGACLYEALTCRMLHAGPDMAAVFSSALRGDAPTFGADVPWELAEICRRATACAPSERFPSAEAFGSAIDAYLEHREAHALVDTGQRAVESLREAIGRYGSATTPEGRASIAAEIHRTHTEAHFSFGRALDVWGGVRGARESARDADESLLGHALDTEDLALAERVLPACATEPLRARVATLRERLDGRARELHDLRDHARRMDWSAIAAPLGTVFITAGLAGGGGGFVTTLGLQYRHVGPVLPALGVVWALVALGIGAAAVARLRRSGVPDSLVSPRMLGIWGAVALGCVLVGIMNEVMHDAPFHGSCYSALMIAIGFAAMAFQTQRWLLAPAAAFFACGVLMAVFSTHAIAIFGATWLVVNTSVGVALHRGATLEERRR